MEPRPEPPKIEIEQKTLRHLNTARKWAMFLAIIGFIVNGLIFILVIASGAFLTYFKTAEEQTRIPEMAYIAGAFIFALIFFFPLFYLFRFSKNSNRAVHNYTVQSLHKAVRNLKSFFVYIGIIVIILLLLYVAVLLVVGSTMVIPKGLF